MRDEWSIDGKCFGFTPSPLTPSAIIVRSLKNTMKGVLASHSKHEVTN